MTDNSIGATEFTDHQSNKMIDSQNINSMILDMQNIIKHGSVPANSIVRPPVKLPRKNQDQNNIEIM